MCAPRGQLRAVEAGKAFRIQGQNRQLLSAVGQVDISRCRVRIVAIPSAFWTKKREVHIRAVRQRLAVIDRQWVRTGLVSMISLRRYRRDRHGNRRHRWRVVGVTGIPCNQRVAAARQQSSRCPGNRPSRVLSSVSRIILLFAFPFDGAVIATSPVGVPALPVAVRFNCTGALWRNELTGCPACVSDKVTVAVPVPLPLCQLLINLRDIHAAQAGGGVIAGAGAISGGEDRSRSPGCPPRRRPCSCLP